MKKTRVFGQDCKAVEPKKKIEAIKMLSDSGEMIKWPDFGPWEVVMLMERAYTGDGLDLMWAYHEDYPNMGRMFLGHWNGGVV